jgi:hypothetical protein
LLPESRTFAGPFIMSSEMGFSFEDYLHSDYLSEETNTGFDSSYWNGDYTELQEYDYENQMHDFSGHETFETDNEAPKQTVPELDGASAPTLPALHPWAVDPAMIQSSAQTSNYAEARAVVDQS